MAQQQAAMVESWPLAHGMFWASVLLQVWLSSLEAPLQGGWGVLGLVGRPNHSPLSIQPMRVFPSNENGVSGVSSARPLAQIFAHHLHLSAGETDASGSSERLCSNKGPVRWPEDRVTDEHP